MSNLNTFYYHCRSALMCLSPFICEWECLKSASSFLKVKKEKLDVKMLFACDIKQTQPLSNILNMGYLVFLNNK